ncbi:hypothetical protein B0H15DRAFT_954525 [Mycena belliarum]|uniref:Cysteine-rich transmembrane CYSTM domain-containing protein n=1 Tax=Mycena belliarum TaxID=1033014 RepID=A0AAD6TYI1_9AGAR|nr:hypothetical protein B0H15DRAFT_954525 [Mycena belliae]
MSAPAKQATTAQPQATEMNVMSAGPAAKAGACKHGEQCTHEHKAARVRGGGAGKDCLLGMLGCFLCFECCEGCCECIADIVCCPCEMCC